MAVYRATAMCSASVKLVGHLGLLQAAELRSTCGRGTGAVWAVGVPVDLQGTSVERWCVTRVGDARS